ncbi:MAG TPA: response regulator [Blastocatellia bacterium]|nr:response regulator [Blastocatellia bacterium]
MKSILVVDDEPMIPPLVGAALKADGYELLAAENAASGLAVLQKRPVDLLIADVESPEDEGFGLIAAARQLHAKMKIVVMAQVKSPETAIEALRHHVCELLFKPFSVAELRDTVHSALAAPELKDNIEILSAKPNWLTLRIPCHLGAMQPLYRVITNLDLTLDMELRESVGIAFRELLQNAIEHGCKCEEGKFVEVSYIRLQRAIVCYIKDFGEGFKLHELEHAAISNPADEPYSHLNKRAEIGMRPGGFGLMLAQQMVDELVYNEAHNEVMFVKYLCRE